MRKHQAFLQKKIKKRLFCEQKGQKCHFSGHLHTYWRYIKRSMSDIKGSKSDIVSAISIPVDIGTVTAALVPFQDIRQCGNLGTETEIIAGIWS